MPNVYGLSLIYDCGNCFLMWFVPLLICWILMRMTYSKGHWSFPMWNASSICSPITFQNKQV